MCGITGFHDTTLQLNQNELQSMITKMAEELYHRGPDKGGWWVDPVIGVALGHRRLSVIDLSEEGCQPMHSFCGRYVIVFNGEIYNYKALACELKGLGYSFRSHSDTEVMLAAISEWGLENAVCRFNGMFAFALWDKKECVLYLVRDRLGKKPLYYGWMGKTFLFGSELKALRAYPKFVGEIDRDVLALYLRHGYISAPYSIYKGLCKLLPGTILAVHGNKQEIKPMAYWSARDIIAQGVTKPFEGSEEEAVAYLEALLRDAVKLRMEADVPLGAFLSGGIDSSTVVALMQAQSIRPVKTFTIGFNEANYDEAKDAKTVARYLGTEHTELYLTPKEARAVIPRLPALYDEPFADSSQIPTFLVSELARQHVTVSLSGDGGDELFAGYNHYFLSQSIWRKIGWLPKSLRGIIAMGLTSLSPQQWDALFQMLNPMLLDKMKQQNPGDKLHKLAEVIDVDRQETMYRNLVSHWKNPALVVLGATEPPTIFSDTSPLVYPLDFAQWMMYLDMITYLPDDILVKVDRASMGVSLEARVPFLDYRVVEFAWRVPLSMKSRNGQGKWLLRQILYKYVPQELIERPKMGFGVPIDSWLRGPLKAWADELLSKDRLEREGFFRPEPIRKLWKEHLSGQRNWQYHLWDVLMFQAWLEGSHN